MVLKDEAFIEEKNLQDYQRRRKEKKVRNWKEKTLHGELVQQTSAVAGERTLRTSSAWIRALKHYCVGCAETPLTQYGIFSVGAGSLPKENTVSATTGWLFGYTGSCVESMSWSVTTKMVRPSALIRCKNGKVRITSNTTICTKKKLKLNQPDITVAHKDTQEWTLIDMAVPADQNILTTEEEKVERYQELAFEVKEIPQGLESGSTNTHLRMQKFGMEN